MEVYRLGARKKLFDPYANPLYFALEFYVPPAFVGISFGNRDEDMHIPIDIVKLILTGADIVIPDNRVFHKELGEPERSRRATVYFDVCKAIVDVYDLDSKIILASELSNVPFSEVRDVYEKSPRLKKIFDHYFRNNSLEYVLAESAICVRMEELGYRTKIGPPAEKKFDAITGEVCNLHFLYTIPAKTLHTTTVINNKRTPLEVVDYITTSMSHRGVSLTDRITFSDSESSIARKIEFANYGALKPIYIMATIAESLLKKQKEVTIEIPESYDELSRKTQEKLLKFIIRPVKEQLEN